MRVIDSHIHLFATPYAAVFRNAHIRQEGELALFEEYRQAYGIEKAFVIGYHDERNPSNNDYILKLARRHSWVLPFGYLRVSRTPLVEQARKLARRGFRGLSLYLDSRKSCRWLAQGKMPDFWSFLQERGLPISINMSWKNAAALAKALACAPGCKVLVSHMARPVVTGGKLGKSYREIGRLADFPNVFVKLSGFYAFAKEGWRYPQMELAPAVDFLKKTFTVKRLVFGSDFAPVLEHNTMRQTVEFLRTEYGGFTRAELRDVYYGNAARLV